MDTIKQPNLIRDLIPEEYQLKDPIYEMADELKRYRRDIRNAGHELYMHVILVCVLGKKIPYLEHWRREIYNFCAPVIRTKFKTGGKNIDRGKYVRNEMMGHYMGARFEDYGPEDIESALDSELYKGRKMLSDEQYKDNWKKICYEYNIIKDVREHLSDIPERVLQPMMRFYDEFVDIASRSNRMSVEEALDELRETIENLKPVVE